MATYTLNDLVNQTLSNLNEDANSSAAQLNDGTGGVSETTYQAITRYLAEGVGIMARSCMAWRVASGSTTSGVNVTLTAATARQPLDVSVATDVNGSVVWFPTGLWYNGAWLGPPTDQSYIYMNPYLNPGYVATATVTLTPSKWVRLANTPQIMLVPAVVTGTATVGVDGYGIPPMPAATATGATVSWIAQDQVLYLTTYAAYRVAFRNSGSDDRLTSAIPGLVQAFSKIQADASSQLESTLPYEYRAIFRNNLVQLGGTGAYAVSQTNPNQ